jgi:Flp pilus assembly protein TadG
MSILSRFLTSLRGMLRDRAGHIAVTLALAAIPLVFATGAGIDYARGLVVRSNMTDALDSAALAVGRQTSKPANCPGGSPAEQTACDTIRLVAQQFFAANYKQDTYGGAGTMPTVSISIVNESVTLTAHDNVPTTFLAVADRMVQSTALDNMAISTSSTVVWGQTKLWVALVLDNTGSMCEPDSNPCYGDAHTNIKINALKTASHSLLTTLKNASDTPGDVMVSIVPFTKDVNVGTGNVGATWIDWSNWTTNPSITTPSSNVGPGDSCPISSSYGDSTGRCLTQPGGALVTSTSNSAFGTMINTNTVPTSGMICPASINSSSSGQSGHYYNGCFNSVANTFTASSGSSATCGSYTHCSCSGSGSHKVCTATTYAHTWVTNPTSTWRGCVMDRTQDDDVNNNTPGTKFLAENDDSCPYASVTPMTSPTPNTTALMNSMYTNLNAQIDNMVAGGGTNQTIGLAHGMQMLVSGAPYNSSSLTLPANTTRYIILLSDGFNTMDRWYGNGSSQSSSVDTRMSTACTNAKNKGYVIYTILVDLGGSINKTVMQNCATDTSKFFDLTTSGAIITAFDQIAQQITNLRVSG